MWTYLNNIDGLIDIYKEREIVKKKTEKKFKVFGIPSQLRLTYEKASETRLLVSRPTRRVVTIKQDDI